MNSLLIDFGASRVKTAISDLSGGINYIKDYSPVTPSVFSELKFEVPILEIKDLFYKIIKDYLKYDIKSVFICSEQHGFAIKDINNNFITDYISWKDNRAFEKIDGLSTIDFIKDKLPDFKKRTGMNIKAGLPSINLLHLMRLKILPKKIKILTLPDILCGNKIHSTMLAGLGIWDIYKKEPYKDLFDLYKEMGYEISFNEPAYNVCISETLNKNLSVYSGIGDNQCAIFGSYLNDKDVIINMGTGSQIAKIDELNTNAKMEQRPYFDKKNLSIITHIPSGRALNCFIGFINDCFSYANSKLSAWNLLEEITIKDIMESSIEFDLNVFESSYKFLIGGGIRYIMEYNLNLKNYLSSLIKSYIEQYFAIIDEYSIGYSKIVLAGGIPRKLNIIKKYIEEVKNINVFINEFEQDETLNGLKNIAILFGVYK